MNNNLLSWEKWLLALPVLFLLHGTAMAQTPPCPESPAPFNFTSSVQDLTIPVGVTRIITTATGADGGNENIGGAGGAGGNVAATFSVNPGDLIRVIIGAHGNSAAFSGGGGGGTAVINCGNPANCATGTLLLVAGGGGGADFGSGGGGATNTAGSGNGGGGGSHSGGGGGLNSAGQNGSSGGPGGGQANLNASSPGGGNGGIGFGGGGASNDFGGGGGGGYTGGNAGSNSPGAGGSNFVAPGATNIINNGGANGGGANRDGVVIISFDCNPCPDFSNPAPVAQVTNSTCVEGCQPSNGSISAPATSCPAGSFLQYSVNDGDDWSTTLPVYAQAGPAQTILTRCVCEENNATVSQTASVTTAPANCIDNTPTTITATVTPTQPVCPDLTQGSLGIDLTGELNSNACGTEYAIVAGNTFSGSPSFTAITSDPFNITSGFGTAVGTYTLRIRLTSNTSIFQDYTYTLSAPVAGAAATWTGAVNTDWATPCNWDVGAIPAAATEVTIPNVANDPVVMAGTAAVAQSVHVQPNAALTIAAMGSLSLEGDTGSPSGGMYNQGTVTNNGSLLIGQNINPGQYGIVNEAIFDNNTDAEIRIDRTSNMGIWNSLAAATLTNSGTIVICETAGTNSVGLRNEGDVQNTGGEIRIDRFNGAGIHNFANSTFSNSGKIAVGKTVTGFGPGIYNFGQMENLPAGEIELDRTNSGIYNTTANNTDGSSFINEGKITVGQTASVNGPGIYNQTSYSNATPLVTFENKAGGEILLDRTSAGVHNDNNCSFDNSGLIKIATTALGTGFNPAIYNRSTFNNTAAGEIRVDSINRTGLHHQSGTFTNGGKIVLGINWTVATFSPGVYNEATFVNQEDAEIHIDRFEHVGFQNAFNSSMTNAGLIKIGENVLGGNNGLYNDGTFENQATGEIHVDNIPDANNRNGVFSASGDTFTNAGKIFIGSAVGGGTTGLFNAGTFGNSGEITVDNIRGTFGRHGLFHDSGTFTNTGKITLGSIDSIGDWGIYSRSTFNNNAGGEITIDRCKITGIRNGSFGFGGTFTNAGKLTIGANAGVGNWGVWNDSPFTNSGELSIDNAAITGLRHQSNVFTNSGAIELGRTATVGEWGLWSQSYFLNLAAGEISIDRTSSTGLLVLSDTLHNRGTITIGKLAPVGPQAIYNGQTIRNFPCGVINIYAPLHNVSNFTNSGLFYVNTAGVHTNTAFALNSGIITYPQGNPIPNVTNQEIIIAPLTVDGCEEISPAFSLGSPVDFAIQGIFTDAAGTMSAGSYDVMTNTFTASPVLEEGIHNLFVKIEDPVGMCTPIVSWELTTQNCCDAPQAVCKPATVILVGNSASIVVADVDNGSTADCGLQSINVSPNVFDCSHVGTPQTVTLTVTDVKGAISTCTTTVTVQDNTAPTITCPATQTLVLGANCTASLPNYTSLATTGDNCGVQSVTQSPTIGTTVSGAGNMTVTLTVTDVNGLSNSCTFTVTKVDNTPPTVICKSGTVFLNATGDYTLLAADVFNSAASSDNCSGELTVTNISPATVNCSQLGQTIPVTVTVQDASGNMATCIAQMTVQEGNTLPSGWSNNNVGNANGSGGYKPCTASGQFTVAATGFSMSSSDVFHLTSRQLCGNGEIIARVASVTNGGWAGITLRESLAPGAKMVVLKTQSNGNIRRMIRTTTNGAANNLNYSRPQHNWLRLVRDGSNFVGYTSLNGTNWTFAFSATVSMTGCIYAGLFAESINNTVTTTAVFDNVTVTGAIAPLIESGSPAATSAAPDFEVYPNPTTGEVTIDLRAFANRAVRLEVYDVQGKVVKMLEVDVAETTTQQLDLSDCQNGIYLIRVKTVRVENVLPLLPDATKRVVVHGKD